MASTTRSRTKVLWCTKAPAAGRNGWEFPKAVREVILANASAGSVLHLFGGRADFGIRMDIDISTRPHVVADAWLPPFARDSFDIVVIDPPYVGEFRSLSNEKTRALFSAAAWIARKRVIWFSTIWVESPVRCKLEKAWLVRVGRHCVVRCLQIFEVPPPDRKLAPVRKFKRGPAIKYNRWLQQPQGLPFGPHREVTL